MPLKVPLALWREMCDVENLYRLREWKWEVTLCSISAAGNGCQYEMTHFLYTEQSESLLCEQCLWGEYDAPNIYSFLSLSLAVHLLFLLMHIIHFVSFLYISTGISDSGAACLFPVITIISIQSPQFLLFNVVSFSLAVSSPLPIKSHSHHLWVWFCKCSLS